MLETSRPREPCETKSEQDLSWASRGALRRLRESAPWRSEYRARRRGHRFPRMDRTYTAYTAYAACAACAGLSVLGAVAAAERTPVRGLTGLTSHVICSDTFISGLPPGEAFDEVVATRPGLGIAKWGLSYTVDREK